MKDIEDVDVEVVNVDEVVLLDDRIALYRLQHKRREERCREE